MAKRGHELDQDEHDSKRQALEGALVGPAVKLLLTAEEALTVYGTGGLSLKVIKEENGTEMRLSAPDRLYPGTTLQELVIQGETEGSILGAMAQVFMKITEKVGRLASYETADLKPMNARVKLIVPTTVAQRLLGGLAQATVMKELEQIGGHMHIEPQSIPPNAPAEGSEQVICLDGTLDGIQLGLQKISTLLVEMAEEPWFPSWAATSLAGTPAPGFLLFQSRAALMAPKAEPEVCIPDAALQGQTTQQSDGIMVLKFLVHDFEASSIVGPGGTRIRELSKATQTKITLTGRTEFYPGTQLQELRIWGQTEEPVLAAATAAVNRLAIAGRLQETIPEGGPGPETEIRVKLLVPLAILKKLMENGGALLKQLQDQSKLFPCVGEDGVAPTALLVEQVLNLSGPLGGARAALAFITGLYSTVIHEPWFAEWSAQSQCPKPDAGLPSLGGAAFLQGSLLESGVVLAQAQAQAQGVSQIQTQGKAQSRAEAEAQALAEIETEAQATGLKGMMAMLIRKSKGSMTEKEQKAKMIQMELLLEMEMTMEKELLAEMDAMGKGAEVRALMLKSKGLLPIVEPEVIGTTSQGGTQDLQTVDAIQKLMAMIGPSTTNLSNLTLPQTPAAAEPDKTPVAMQGQLHSRGMDLLQKFQSGLCDPANADPVVVAPAVDLMPKPAIPELPAKPGAPVGIKFLVDVMEVQCIKNQDPALVLLQKQAGARIMLSETFFPGCVGLQEIRLLAPSAAKLLSAMITVLSKITEVMGKLSCGELDVEFGHACIKMLVPARAADSIIGPDGQNVKQLNEVCGVKTYVDMNSIPCAKDVTEQGICLSGSMQAVFAALPTILKHVDTYSSEKWFKSWITTSNSGKDITGLLLFAEGKGRGKGSTGNPSAAELMSQMMNAPAAVPSVPAGADPNSLLIQLAQTMAQQELAGRNLFSGPAHSI